MNDELEAITELQKQRDGLNIGMLGAIPTLEAALRKLRIDITLHDASPGHRRLRWDEYNGEWCFIVLTARGQMRLIDVPMSVRTELIERDLPTLLRSIPAAYELEIWRYRRALDTIVQLIEALKADAAP